MPPTRHFFAARPARPSGPRCHGGVSSLLRIAQRAAPAAGSSRQAGLLRDTGFADSSLVEHYVSVPAALGGGR